MFSRVEEEIELLERHIRILRIVVDKEPIGILKLSETSDLPTHKIRYSLRILEQCNMIRPSHRGAVSTDKSKRYLTELPAKLDQLEKRLEGLKQII